jgi:hypothetical protein
MAGILRLKSFKMLPKHNFFEVFPKTEKDLQDDSSAEYICIFFNAAQKHFSRYDIKAIEINLDLAWWN